MTEETRQALQRAFDVSCAGLAAQGFERALDSPPRSPVCVVIDARGRRCAISHMAPEMGDGPMTCLADVGPRLAGLYGPAFGPWCVPDGEHDDERRAAADFRDRMITAHDYGATPGEMRRRLREVAAAFGLSRPACIEEPPGEG